MSTSRPRAAIRDEEVRYRFEGEKSLSRVVRVSGWGSGRYSSDKART